MQRFPIEDTNIISPTSQQEKQICKGKVKRQGKLELFQRGKEKHKHIPTI